MSTQELSPGDWRRAVYGRSHISGNGKRLSPRAGEREGVIARQGYRCLYCEIPIGTHIWRKTREVVLRPNWDHFVPFAYSQRNPSANWVLACHVCNSLKTARIFADVESVRRAILPERLAKGYEEPGAVFHRLNIEREQHVVLITAARPTERQLEALQLFAAGMRPGQIGDVMGLGYSRPSSLLREAARRMGVETREEAVEVALRNGFITRPAPIGAEDPTTKTDVAPTASEPDGGTAQRGAQGRSAGNGGA